MSKRNAYRISVTEQSGYKYEALKQRLNDLFEGHVEETAEGFHAEDSPGVDSAFSDGDPRYVGKRTFVRVMHEQIFDGWADDRFLGAREQYEAVADMQPEDAGQYADIISHVRYHYANDTSGERRETDLSL